MQSKHRILHEYLSPGIRVIGLDVLESAIVEVLQITGAQHVVSVGSGLGVAEAALNFSTGITVHTVDPDPTSFNHEVPPSVATMPPKYGVIDDLISDEVMLSALQRDGMVLLLLWPPPDNNDGTGYDIDAVRRLQPSAIVTVFNWCGTSGSWPYLCWLHGLQDSLGNNWALPEGALSNTADDTAQGSDIADSSINASYTLTFQYRRYGYLRRLSKDALDWMEKDGGLQKIVVQVGPESELGIIWDGKTKVLKSVAPDSALARAGGADLAGWRLTYVNNTWMNLPGDVEHAARMGEPLELQLIRNPFLIAIFTCMVAVRRGHDAGRLQPTYIQGDGLLCGSDWAFW